MSDERERCPRCGVRWELGRDVGGVVHTPNGIDCLRRQLAQTQEQLQQALVLLAMLLRGLEWSGWDERFQAHMCPVCGGYKSKNKHFPDCDLNKALSFLRDVGRE